MILLINVITLFIEPIKVTNDYYAKDPSIELHPAELRSNKKILNLKLVTMLEFERTNLTSLQNRIRGSVVEAGLFIHHAIIPCHVQNSRLHILVLA